MDGLISEKGKTKLIFFAVDDESVLPTKKEVRDHFPESSYNIYKAWGNFRHSVDIFETIFRIKKYGIKSTRSYSNDRIITHIYRIDTKSYPDSFFILKYNTSLVGFFEVCRDDLAAMKELINHADKQYSLMNKMNDYIDNFDAGTKLAKLLNVKDKTMSCPDQKSINKLFANYGEDASQKIIKNINQLIEKLKWH